MEIFITSIAEKLGFHSVFLKIGPGEIYSPKGKKESSSQVQLVSLLKDFSTFRFFNVYMYRICIVNCGERGVGTRVIIGSDFKLFDSGIFCGTLVLLIGTSEEGLYVWLVHVVLSIQTSPGSIMTSDSPVSPHPRKF